MEAWDIRCFQHCSGASNILCFNVPPCCPLCGQNVAETGMRIPPYLIDSPFVHAGSTKCCVVIKPTVTDFLYNFTNNSDLHIGLTNSAGRVYEFDERGVTVGNHDWGRCLQIEMIDAADRMFDQWDRDLEVYINERYWKAEYYDEQSHNCFDFVLGFLRHFGLDRVYPSIIDRKLFCKDMVLPVTDKAGKYISLYRNIAQNGYILQNIGH